MPMMGIVDAAKTFSEAMAAYSNVSQTLMYMGIAEDLVEKQVLIQ